jgi:superoxide reductase
MAEKLEIYKCDVCGNIVEILHGGKGKLICCAKEMRLFKENTVDAAKEKHVPVIEKTANGVKVTVGAVAHPMLAEHWIEWIQVIDGAGKSYRKFLNPGDAPEAEFCIQGDNLAAREYCNLHGLWKA